MVCAQLPRELLIQHHFCCCFSLATTSLLASLFPLRTLVLFQSADMRSPANYGPNLGRSGFVPGVGRVPTSPGPSRRRISTSGEEGEIFNLSSSSSVSSRRLPGSVRGNRYLNYSLGSSSSFDRNQPYAETARSSERRTLESRNGRGSYEWHQAATTHQDDYISRGSQRNTHYSAHSRSRSRSPVRVRHPNGNMFSRTGNLLAEQDDPLFPRRLASLLETPPFVEYPRAPPQGCRCCVSEICQFRREDSKDCRPLVPTLRPWMKLAPQESQIV